MLCVILMKGPLVTRARFSWIFFLTCDISDRSITTDRSWLFSRIEKIIKARKLSDFFTFNHLIMSHFSRLAIFFQHSNLSLLWRIYPLIFSFYRCYTFNLISILLNLSEDSDVMIQFVFGGRETRSMTHRVQIFKVGQRKFLNVLYERFFFDFFLCIYKLRRSHYSLIYFICHL